MIKQDPPVIVNNTISDMKKFFTPEDGTLSIAAFKAEWDQLSKEEKDWFKTQPLK